MKNLLLLVCLAIISTCYAQKQVTLEQLKDHINDSVKVEGKIYGVRYLETAQNTPTFINVGAAYPNQLLTVVIWGNVRKDISIVPNTKDVGNRIVVSGKVELYNNKPQIVIKDPKQFEIIQDAQKDLD